LIFDFHPHFFLYYFYLSRKHQIFDFHPHFFLYYFYLSHKHQLD
jgi:hypothetical protein